MGVKTSTFFWLLLSGLSMAGSGAAAAAGKRSVDAVVGGRGVLWSNPRDIASRDLYFGPGGRRDQPRGPYTFIKEDLDGSNPKFVVRDRNGVRWKVKLGVEARPETAATRFVWAVGYAANEDYLLRNLRVENMPPRLRRGHKLIAPDGSMHDARLKREGAKKIGIWRWRHNPFAGTREWNGLRVLMAVINNWDLKDENNSVYLAPAAENVFMVSDLGASFGTVGASWPLAKAKGNLRSYSRSKFIRRSTPASVDFYVPARPQTVFLVHPRDFFRRLSLRWIGRTIPSRDVHWMAGLLSQLSARQIQDAFRAAGYSPDEVSEFASVVERRIALLSDL